MADLLTLREIVALELPRIHGWNKEQKKILWENTVHYFLREREKIPDEMKTMGNARFKLDLAYDETFCADVGIPYASVDNYWDDLRAAVALWCYEQ